MVEVRLATEAEYRLAWEIMLDSFEEYRGVLVPASSSHEETETDYRRTASQGGVVLALVGGVPVGSARYVELSDHVYCGRVSVLPNFRGHGIASAMLDLIHSTCRDRGYSECRLATREVLGSNIRLYTRLGYEIVSRAPHPRGAGMVVEMVKHL